MPQLPEVLTLLWCGVLLVGVKAAVARKQPWTWQHRTPSDGTIIEDSMKSYYHHYFSHTVSVAINTLEFKLAQLLVAHVQQFQLLTSFTCKNIIRGI